MMKVAVNSIHFAGVQRCEDYWSDCIKHSELKIGNYWSYRLFVRLDVRTHLTVHCQISSDIYLVNLGIKSNVDWSEGI